jgi:malate synthase
MLDEKPEDRAVAHAESAKFHHMNYAPTDLNPKKDLPALSQWVLNGKGASLLDGYVDDLATDRIYGLMIAQRVRHKVKVRGDNS